MPSSIPTIRCQKTRSFSWKLLNSRHFRSEHFFTTTTTPAIWPSSPSALSREPTSIAVSAGSSVRWPVSPCTFSCTILFLSTPLCLDICLYLILLIVHKNGSVVIIFTVVKYIKHNFLARLARIQPIKTLTLAVIVDCSYRDRIRGHVPLQETRCGCALLRTDLKCLDFKCCGFTLET